MVFQGSKARASVPQIHPLCTEGTFILWRMKTFIYDTSQAEEQNFKLTPNGCRLCWPKHVLVIKHNFSFFSNIATHCLD